MSIGVVKESRCEARFLISRRIC